MSGTARFTVSELDLFFEMYKACNEYEHSNFGQLSFTYKKLKEMSGFSKQKILEFLRKCRINDLIYHEEQIEYLDNGDLRKRSKKLFYFDSVELRDHYIACQQPKALYLFKDYFNPIDRALSIRPKRRK